MSAVLCAYVAGYCLWTVYMRHGHPTSGAKEEQRGWMHFMRRDLCQALALYWILLMVSISLWHSQCHMSVLPCVGSPSVPSIGMHYVPICLQPQA